MDYPNRTTTQTRGPTFTVPPLPPKMEITPTRTTGWIDPNIFGDPVQRAMDTIDQLKRDTRGVTRMTPGDYDPGRTINNETFLDKFLKTRNVLRVLSLAFRLNPYLRFGLTVFELIAQYWKTTTRWDMGRWVRDCGPHQFDWEPLFPVAYGVVTDGAGGSPLICGLHGHARPNGVANYMPPDPLNPKGQSVFPNPSQTFSMWQGDWYTDGIGSPIARTVSSWSHPTNPPYIDPVKITERKLIRTPWVHEKFRWERMVLSRRDIKEDWKKWQEEQLIERDEAGNSTPGRYSSSDGYTSRSGGGSTVDGVVDWTPPTRREPPRGPGDRDVKLKANAAILASLRIINAVYGKLVDFKDIVKALHDSLPKEMQVKKVHGNRTTIPIQKYIEAIMKNPGHMDPTKAFLGVVKELAEDRVGGFGAQLRAEIGNLTKRLSIGSNTGFGL